MEQANPVTTLDLERGQSFRLGNYTFVWNGCSWEYEASPDVGYWYRVTISSPEVSLIMGRWQMEIYGYPGSKTDYARWNGDLATVLWRAAYWLSAFK